MAKQIKSTSIVVQKTNVEQVLEQPPVDFNKEFIFPDPDLIDTDPESALVDIGNANDDGVTVINNPTKPKVLKPPTSVTLITQSVNMAEDGGTTVDWILEIGDVDGAVDYEVRVVLD